MSRLATRSEVVEVVETRGRRRNLEDRYCKSRLRSRRKGDMYDLHVNAPGRPSRFAITWTMRQSKLFWVGGQHRTRGPFFSAARRVQLSQVVTICSEDTNARLKQAIIQLPQFRE